MNRKIIILFLCFASPLVSNVVIGESDEAIVPSFHHTSLAVAKWDYPRPTLQRSDLLCLNGGWQFGITHRDDTNIPNFTAKIIVPFPLESKLSGLKRLFTEQQRLWYQRTFTIPKEWADRRIFLHFEASDWESQVWLNGKRIGIHRGGYDRFSYDITKMVTFDNDQKLVVSVLDPTDAGYQSRGKQVLHSHQTFYTACSGIWQTVWAEPVGYTSIESLKIVPDIDSAVLNVTAYIQGETNGISVVAVAKDKGKEIERTTGEIAHGLQIRLPNAKLWSPTTPFLYDLEVSLIRGGEEIDHVTSYFGMRKISTAVDDKGFPRLLLNNKILFQLGPLDQGYWPDGIYTAPSDDALRHDIEIMKSLGFNMVRKHVKVEPERWYYWCDKLGLLVWQDMPSGDRPASRDQKEIRRKPESAEQFELELRRLIVGRGNHPSIVVWVPFNQGWGQYDTARICNLVKELDPSRLVIAASGWHDLGIGDIRALHQYPGPATPEHDGRRPCVLGECGGLAYRIEEHTHWPRGYWNLTFFKSPEELFGAYETLLGEIRSLATEQGLSGAVITQLTDVEREVSGFLTYDRQVMKMPVDKVRAVNESVIAAASAEKLH